MALTPFTVQTESELAGVWRLTYDVYLKEGYTEANAEHRVLAHMDYDGIDETKVYGVADEAGAIIATCSATVDGWAGLHTDRTFPNETDFIRMECHNARLRLGSSWRIVTEPHNRGKVKPLLLVIDRTLKEFGKLIDVWLFTFHPKHAPLYEHFLDLHVIAKKQHDATMHGNPVVLMRGETAAMQRAWASGPGGRIQCSAS